MYLVRNNYFLPLTAHLVYWSQWKSLYIFLFQLDDFDTESLDDKSSKEATVNLTKTDISKLVDKALENTKRKVKSVQIKALRPVVILHINKSYKSRVGKSKYPLEWILFN